MVYRKRRISRRKAVKQLGAAFGVASLLPAFSLSGCSNKSLDADVLVIGAGLAGLNASILLQDQGLDVVILEASTRVGGRVFTMDDIDGHPDAGGSEIGASYARVLDMLGRLGNPDMANWLDQVDPDVAVCIDGGLIRLKDWPDATQNHLSGPERAIPPIALTRFFMPTESPLADLASWVEPAAREFDIPLGKYLRSRGASDEALRLISQQVPSDTLDGTSLLWTLRNQRAEQAGGGIQSLRRIKAGASRLPEGMARLLKHEVRFDAPVSGIRSNGSGVEVQDTHGRKYRASYALCTLPMSMARGLRFDPVLPPLQAEALSTIPQGHATSVFFHVKEPYWEVDGLPAGFWSNTTTGWVLRYRSDSGYYLWLFKDGSKNHPWRTMDDDSILKQATADLAAVRPSTVGRVTPAGVFNWSRYPWLLGGNGYRAPGDISKFGNCIADAHGRIHFAGVDTAVTSTGMEGAMESGERAALEILQRL
ncbi:MAG: NAD(P)/FAD-dependent oxidoreductase [Gammaproteobacteria bacterium]